MSEPIISKTCTKCKREKPVSQFYVRRASEDGFSYRCKECVLTWQRSANGRAAVNAACRRYHKSKKGKQAVRKYRQTQKGKLANRLANLTAAGKARTKAYRLRYPDRYKARKKVNHLVEAGELPPASSLLCQCGKTAEHYHHHNGYEPPHDTDVIPVCRVCHYRIHN